MSKNRSKEAAINEIKQQAISLLGEIVIWQTGIKTTYTGLKTALSSNGLDERFAKEFLPKHAFTRAARKLEEDRIIDSVPGNGTGGYDEAIYQFTRREFDPTDTSIEAGGANVYRPEVFLRLNTSTGKISCKDKGLELKAQELLDNALQERTTSDISGVVQKLFDAYAKNNPDGNLIRAGGRAYFILDKHSAFVDQVESFLKTLHGRLDRWPIPAGVKRAEETVTNNLTSFLESLIEDHRAAVARFDLRTRPDTIEAVAKEINDTRVRVQAYAVYLKEQEAVLSAALDGANTELTARVEALAVERKTLPPGESGLDAIGCRPNSQGGTINKVLRSDASKTAEVIAEESGLPLVRVKSHLNYWTKQGRILCANGSYWLPTTKEGAANEHPVG